MAELHIVGELQGATGFEGRNVFCKWAMTAGSGWEVIEGLDSGQTQVDHPGDADMAVWAHPIDVHLVCKGLTGWPRLFFEVWELDDGGRTDICGYGFCHVPCAPGAHHVSCPTWIPQGLGMDAYKSFFVGGHPRLKHSQVVYKPGERFLLQTESRGMVHARLCVVVKDFARNHVHFGTQETVLES